MDTLLIAVHGTRSDTGQRTIRRLADAVADARPDIPVAIGFLDVLEPSVADVLAGIAGPAVIVPALLSTGVHVARDMPAALGERSDARLARHLGPSPMLVDALIDRLREAGSERSVTLVATGSSDPDAASELLETAEDLESVLGRTVYSTSLGSEVEVEPDTDLAAYLLAEGAFYDKAVSLADGVITKPLGDHPAVVGLIWCRYDEALGRAG